MPKAKKKYQTKEQSQPNSETSINQKLLSQQRLYRSETERVVAGVGGGLGEYFNIDPIIPRIFLLILAMLDGVGVIVYILLWLLIPNKADAQKTSEQTMKENVEEIKNRTQELVKEVRTPFQKSDNRTWWGAIIVALGIMLLLNNYNFFGHFGLGKLWPLLIIGFGILILNKKT